MPSIVNSAVLDYIQLGNPFQKRSSATITKVDNIVSFNKTAAPLTVTTGNTVTYTIIITPSAYTTDITGANIKDVIPNGLTLVPNSLKVDGVANSGNLVTGVPLTLSPGKSTTVEYKCTVN